MAGESERKFMEFFIPFADDKKQADNVKNTIVERTIQYFHTEPSFWYRSISFQKEGRLQQASVGEHTNDIYQADIEPIIAIVSVPNTFLVYTMKRGIETWPAIMINSSCIVESETFDVPRKFDGL